MHEQAVVMDHPTDGIERHATVQDAEDPADPDGTAPLLGAAAIAPSSAAAIPWAEYVLMDEDHELVLGLFDPRVQALGRAGAVPEQQDLVWARVARHGDDNRFASSCASSFTQATTVIATSSSSSTVGKREPAHEHVGGGEVPFGIADADAQQLEERRPRRDRGLDGRVTVGVTEPVDGVGGVAGVEQGLHGGGEGEEAPVGGVEQAPGPVSEHPPHQLGDHAVVLEVRHRSADRPRSRQQTSVPVQHRHGVTQPGQLVGVDDAVDRSRVEGRVVAIEVELERARRARAVGAAPPARCAAP